MEDIRANFDSKHYTPIARESVVLRLLDLGIKDDVILAKTAELLSLRTFTKANAVTNVLYAMGKLGYKPKENEMWLVTSIDQILKEPKLDTYLACRNLWNLYALDTKHEVAMQKFAECIFASDVSKMKELDIANAIRAFAHF